VQFLRLLLDQGLNFAGALFDLALSFLEFPLGVLQTFGFLLEGLILFFETVFALVEAGFLLPQFGARLFNFAV
jgi:hypothetical protein